MRRPSARTVDAAIAGVLCAAAALELLTRSIDRGPALFDLLALACFTLPVAWWRRDPVPALAVTVASGIVIQATLFSVQDLSTPLGGLLLLTFGSAAYRERRDALIGLALTVGAIVCVGLIRWTGVSNITFPVVLPCLVWLAGRIARNRAHVAGELHEAAVRAREARDAEAESAIAAERRRIAREMHDIVAHSVSVMVVQAGGARRILEHDPARASEAAALVAVTGRQAAAELRRLLGVLQVEDDHAPAEPTLARIDALVGRARAAGLPVTLRVEGAPVPLPAAVDHAAYRVVQEAITNALKYAGGAPTMVDVSYGKDEVELRVRDRGCDELAEFPVGGAGHGLEGMRERVRALGGELVAGRCDDGGFEVRASLPLAAAPELMEIA